MLRYFWSKEDIRLNGKLYPAYRSHRITHSIYEQVVQLAYDGKITLTCDRVVPEKAGL